MQTKTHTSLTLLTATATLLFIGALIPAAKAADGTWTGGSSVTWTDSLNWFNGTVPGGASTNTDIATFNSATYLFQPTATNSYFLGGLVFGSINGGTTITTGTGLGRLNVGASGIQMVSGSGPVNLGVASAQGVNITANQTWNNDSSSLLYVSRVSVDDAAPAGTNTITITGSGSGGVAVSNNLADVNNAGDSTRKLATVINVSGTGATRFVNGSSTYSGGTTLTAGLLQIGGNGALGTGTVSLNGGRFSSTATSSQSPGNSVTIGGNVALGDAVNTGKLTFNGAIDLGGATRTLTVDSDVVFSNVVSNGGITLTKTGTNKPIMTLSGTNAIAGGLTIGDGTGDDTVRLLSSDQIADTIAVNLVGTNTSNRGILELFTFSDTIGGLSGSGIVQNGSTNTNSASVLTLNVADATTQTSSAVLRNSGTATAGKLYIVKTGGGTQILSGNMTYTGDTTISAGTLQLGDGTLTNDGSLTIPNIINNASLVFNRVGANNSYGGVISGTGNLTKSGAGAQILSGTNTYSGTTTVNGGTLQVNGTISTNTLSVSNGATLAGLGTIGGDVAVSGNLQPGHDATNGALTIGGSLTVAANGVVNLGIDSLAVFDKLVGASSYTVNGAINVTATTNYTPIAGDTFQLFSGAVGGTPTLNVTPLTNSGFAWVTNNFTSNGQISVTNAGVTASINVTGSFSAFSTTAGTASAAQTVTVSGSGLTADVTVTPPAGYEISSDGSTYSSSVTLTQSAGSVASTTIYVRLTGAAAGNPSGNVDFASAGATTQQLAVNGTVQSAYDAWTVTYSLTGANTNGIADPDSDGFNNNREYLFDGNPTNSTPYLIKVTPAGTNAVFNWTQRNSGVTYEVQKNSTLTNAWAGPASVIISNAADQSGVLLPTDYTRKEFIVPATAKDFYRVQAIAP